MSEDSCMISKVKCKASSTRPIIVNFENGVLKPGQEHKVACRLYKRKHNSLLAAATKSMVYTGEVTRNEIYNTFIALIDKKTNKTSLIALDQARMSPWFKESKLLDISNEDKAASVRELNTVFGSKKIKRRTEQLQRMKLDVNNVKEQLEQTVAEVDVDVRDMVAPSLESYDKDSDYKPRINPDAVNVSEVYSLKELVSSGVLSSVSGEVERLTECASDTWGTTAFVTHQFKKILVLESHNAEEICQLLLYIDCLMKFMVTSAKNISNRKYVACSYSELVHNDILNKFSVLSGNTRTRPNIMRDKCLCYILVLSMLASRNALDLNYFSKELKLGTKKLQDVCRILRFTVTKDLVYLKIPLPPPYTPHTKGKKQKTL